MATFHYVPLHSAPAGRKFGRFHGRDEFTTAESDKLFRLPMYYGMAKGRSNGRRGGCIGFLSYPIKGEGWCSL